MMRQDDDLHLCVQHLTMAEILLLLAEFRGQRKGRVIVHYDYVGRALRAAFPLRGLTPLTLLDYLQRINPRFQFVQIKHSSQLHNYPEVHARVLEVTTDVILDYLPCLEKHPLFPLFQHVLGKEPALSFIAKTLGRTVIYPVALALIVDAEQSSYDRLGFWVPLHWSIGLAEIVAQRSDRRYVVKVPQTRLRHIFQHVSVFPTVLALLFTFFVFLWRRGITLGTPIPQKWKIATEFIDAEHLAGWPRHADGIVDREHIQPSDFLLILTHRQFTTLKRAQGGEIEKKAKEATRQRGYHLAMLDELPYSLVELFEGFRLLRFMVTCLIRERVGFGRVLTATFLEDYLDFSSLFIWHRPEHLLYCTFPNGIGTFRTNAGMVTGLARHHEVISVGLQTRSIYLRNWEECFDCFDQYLFWGPRYRQAIGRAGDPFLRQCDFIGCINLDAAMVESVKEKNGSPKSGAVSVLAFSGDVGPRGSDHRHHMMTYQYNRQFVALLIHFAQKNSQLSVRIKLKDPIGLDYFRDDPMIGQYTDSTKIPNLAFLTLERDVYRSELVDADVVTALGFTSPGTDAILLGKPVVFYSQLGGHTSHFTQIPGLVATDDEQFLAMLQAAVDNPRNVCGAQQDFAKDLDPYRDGRAMERAASLLTEIPWERTK